MKSAPSGTVVARRSRPMPGGRGPLPRPSARSHIMGAGSLAATERSQPPAPVGTGSASPSRPAQPHQPAGASARAGAWWIRHGPALISFTSVVLGVLCLLDAFSHHHHPAQDWFTPVLPAP